MNTFVRNRSWHGNVLLRCRRNERGADSFENTFLIIRVSPGSESRSNDKRGRGLLKMLSFKKTLSGENLPAVSTIFLIYEITCSRETAKTGARTNRENERPPAIHREIVCVKFYITYAPRRTEFSCQVIRSALIQYNCRGVLNYEMKLSPPDNLSHARLPVDNHLIIA